MMRRYRVKTPTGTLFETSDINEVLAIKGLKAVPKGKRRLVPLQADRISSNYPTRYEVASLFKMLDLPGEDKDQPSSPEATVAYIKRVYEMSLGAGHIQPRIENGQVYF